MKLRAKLLLVAILPLIASFVSITFVLRQQQANLSHRQEVLVRQSYNDAAQTELRHYVALALSTISPLYNTGRDDAQIQEEAMRRLAQLNYGPDGYFFLYDYDGTNLMHPRQPELVGRNLLELRDSRGQPAIRMMIDKARSGGGFVEYTWNKPSAHTEAPKLAYVTGLPRWQWMLGTGSYTDELDSVVEQLDDQLDSNVGTTLRWIALTAAASVVIVLASVLGLGLTELRAADAKLTLLARDVVRSQEQERAWLSRELHDGTSQTLVSVKLLTEAAIERIAPTEDRARPMLLRALERINDALNAVRGISHRLRPAELDTLGLTTALRQLGQEMCEPVNTAFEFDAVNEPGGLPDEIRTTLFRISQEALTNVCKHAKASRVRMELLTSAAGLRLSIEDDGEGFDSEAIAQHPQRGIGLRNMRERLIAIGGTLHVSSRPQHTSIVAEVPSAAIRRFAEVA
jgi:two-component system, NarL family, sensor kinase